MKSDFRASGPQLSADELQQVKWLLGGILTLISIVTVAYLDIPAWTLMVLTTIAAIAVIARPSWPGRIPRTVHRLAFPFIVAMFAGDLWLNAELLPAMVRLDILLLLYRVISYRQKRDDLQLIVLGLFLVVLAGVLSVSLLFAVHILVFTAGALALLLVLTIAQTSVSTAPIPPGETPAWARHVAWGALLRRVRAVTDWRVVALGTALFAGLVALSALLFVMIPRFQLENGLFLERFVSKKTRSGFSDSIRFGEVTEILQDNSVALSVDVPDRTQIPEAAYWRMLVMDEYRDGMFRLSTPLRRSAFSVEHRGQNVRGRNRASRGAPSALWTFYLEAGISRYLPLLGAFEDLRFREPQNFRTARSLDLVTLRDDPATMIAYRVQGMTLEGSIPDSEFGAQLASRGKNPLAAGALMLGVDLSPSDRAVVEQISAELLPSGPGPAAEFGQRAAAWLGQRHGYSLRPVIPVGTGDPMVRWLSSREAGHCELFAGSMVVLARVAGYPARVVTGYHGGSWNGYSNNFTVRNSDAHAWAELFDAKTQSWIRVDATPGAVNAEAASNAPALALQRRNDRSWKARVESLRIFWYRQIVNFDQNNQIDALTAMKQASEVSSRRAREVLERVGALFRGWKSTPWNGHRLAGAVSGLGMAVVLGVLIVWMRRVWKNKGWRRASAKTGDRVRIEAGRWLGRLSVPGPTYQSTNDCAEVVSALQRIRFGPRESWSDAPATFRRARRIWREKRESKSSEKFAR
jgi:hypothetical protein